MNGYVLVVFLHVLAATVWVGSIVFFTAVVVPVIRRPETRDAAPAFVMAIGARYRVVGTGSLVVLLVTGFLELAYRGIGWSELFQRPLWASAFGRTLAHKLVLVAVVVVATVAHELVTRAGALKHRRAASWIGRVMAIASLAILYFAVRLARGL
jgi:putative copper resistance protein D